MNEISKFFRWKCHKYLKLKGLDTNEDYVNRLNYELDIINKMSYETYFLIVADFIDWARQNNIPVGPGRGSVAGSLVAYVLGITTIDPIPYGLYFERFLNPNRISAPDIDCDFCINRREDVLQYVIKKYGANKVAPIGTFSKMHGKGVVRSAMKAFGVEYNEINHIAKLIPEAQQGIAASLEKAYSIEGTGDELKQYREEDTPVGQSLRIAERLEDLTKSASTHACGVIISDKDLIDNIPLQKPPRKGDIPISQFEMRDIEWLGFIKFDFLGLKTLTVIQTTLDSIKENYNQHIDLEQIDYTDQTVFNFLINDDDLEGIFQMDSEGIRAAFKETKPSSLNEWSDLIALYRPGPIQFLELYNNQKFGRAKNELIFKELEPIYNYTHGVLIYQEQIMRIATDIAGYSLPEADELRKVVGKKLPEEMVKHEDRFIDGCVKKGFDRDKSKELWDAIQKFAHYGFNKSHSIAYAKVGYQTAWLKTYYPAEFLAAHLSLLEDNITIGRALRSAKRLNIIITPPSIYNTESSFKVIDDKISFSSQSVKHIGKNDIKAIKKSNKQFKNHYDNLYDWLLKVTYNGINLRAIKALANIGALDVFEYNRATVINNIESLHDAAKKTVNRSKQKEWLPWNLHEGESNRYIGKVEIKQYPDLSLAEKIKLECEYVGTCISGEPRDMVPYLNKVDNITSIDQLTNEGQIKIFGIITYKKEFPTKKKEQMARITIYDGTNEIGLVLFPKLYKTLRTSLEMYIPIIVHGNLKINDDNKEVLVSMIDICNDQLYNRLSGVHKIQINVGCLILEGITRIPIEDIISIRNSINKSNIDFCILD